MPHVARPPAAPANHVVQRLDPVVKLSTPSGFRVLAVRKDRLRASSVRLYATKRMAFSAPHPRTGAAVPVTSEDFVWKYLLKVEAEGNEFDSRGEVRRRGDGDDDRRCPDRVGSTGKG